jgi:hypothetical protein
MNRPFAVGSNVTWSDGVPEAWRIIWTPGPMKVISARFDEGKPSKYSMKFGGIPRTPGWIILVEYDADATLYYDPSLRGLCGSRIQKEIHQKWLKGDTCE